MADGWQPELLQRTMLSATNSNVTTTGPPSGDQEVSISIALLTQLLLLGLAFVVGRVIEHKKITWIGEAGAALVLGILMGLFLRVCGIGGDYKELLAFDANFFILVLLPPIMFESGFSLNMGPFIRNLGSICAFAFLGTTISMFLIGGHMWLGGQWGMYTPLSFLEACLFGAMISATDPVTVLAVFNKLRAQEDLYIMVFGESVLNDAVGLVLFTTVAKMLEPGFVVNAASVFWGIGMFIYIFLASTLTGCLFGAGAALMFKGGYFMEPEVMLEPALVIVSAFSCYFAAEACGWSGIVAIVFCGIVMNRYVVPNLSPEGERHTRAFFRIVATMCELFVFLYIGVVIFLVPQAWHVFGFTAWCLLALAHSRALNIFPLAAVLNFFSPEDMRIPMKQQLMMWWSGLRGGMAFALSVLAAAQYGEKGRMMSTCTFLICLITVLINGGASPYLLDKMELRQPGATEEHGGPHMLASSDDVDDADINTVVEAASITPRGVDGKLPAMNSPLHLLHKMREFSSQGSLHTSLESFDEKVLGRLLISPNSRPVSAQRRRPNELSMADLISENGDEENVPLTHSHR